MAGTRLAALVVLLSSLMLFFPKPVDAGGGGKSVGGSSPALAAGASAPRPINPIGPAVAFPEPATLALVICGGVLFAWKGLKNRRARA